MENWKKYFFILTLFCIVLLVFSSSSFAANKTNLVVKNNVSKYSEKYEVNIKLTDLDDYPLVNEKVEVIIDGWEFGNLSTDGGGEIVMIFDTSLEGTWYNYGKYLITAKYYGSSQYESNYAEGYIIVKSMPTSLDLKYKETGKKQLAVVTLRDGNNVLASACRVDLYVDGKFYTYVITDENGKAIFDLSGLAPGSHLITARNSDIGHNYIPDEKNMTVIIKDQGTNSSGSVHSKADVNKGAASMKQTGLPLFVLLFLGCLGIFIRRR